MSDPTPDLSSLPIGLKDPIIQRFLSLARHYGQDYVKLAMHAALPLRLTPELVHLLRINFVATLTWNPWVLEADLLLSPLCEEVGDGFYQIDSEMRQCLLDALRYEPGIGIERIRRVAAFLATYAWRKLQTEPPGEYRDFLLAQYFAGMAYHDPKKAAKILATNLRTGLQTGDGQGEIRGLDHRFGQHPPLHCYQPWQAGFPVDCYGPNDDHSQILRFAALTQALKEPLYQERKLVLYTAGLERWSEHDYTGVQQMRELLETEDGSVVIAGVELPPLTELLTNPGEVNRPFRIHIDLPNTGRYFLGYEKYLNHLNQIWNDGKINILVIRGIGGVGKSALVNEWLKEILSDPGKRGVKSIYGHTFHSQGIDDTVVAVSSSDGLIEHALYWFGDLYPSSATPIEKAQRLAYLVRKNRTLLILDGLESLQSPYGPGSEWRLKDSAMQELLIALATNNKGLCIITTRAKVIELRHFLNKTVEEWHLGDLVLQSGVELLKELGVKGSDFELEKVVKNVNGHALTLKLLGDYLRNAYNGDVRYWPEIGLDEGGNYKFRRIMQAYERWLKDRPLELSIMRLLGFFEHKVDMKALEELKKTPIQVLTNTVPKTIDWNYAISNLREMGLISETDGNTPDMLDTHSFVREYFAQRVREQYPSAWQEGHRRLYEYYSKTAKSHPDTIEEMLPLFTAVSHGCKAGLHEKVLEQVYQRRIMRDNKYFSTNKLDAIGSELVALSGFFDKPWTVPVSSLSEESKGYVLKEAGFHLLALGRPEEAVEPTEQALKIWEKRGDQHHAVRAASKLSELFLTLGHLNDALNYAKQSEKLAGQIDRDEGVFQQMAKVNLAAALHQLGMFDKANNAFEEAAQMQKEREPERPLLYPWQGFRYCDLLLDIGEREQSLVIFQKVQQHANQTLGWMGRQGWPFDIALNSLVLGRTLLLIGLKTKNIDENIGNSNLEEAEIHLDKAVKNLRNSNRFDYLPYSLIIRSILYRKIGRWDNSKRDLDEALELAESSKMRIYQADAYLQFAYFYITKSEFWYARSSLEKAKTLIKEMNYHRQDWRVVALERLISA